MADKISAVFVPVIVMLAIFTWTVWFSIIYSAPAGEYTFQFAFDFGISTLVVACPCALGLATPTAVMVGTGLAASYGILIKGADVLEKVNRITTVVFDKTGTLTSGKPSVNACINCSEKYNLPKAISKEYLHHILHLAEQNSEHPIAKAICTIPFKE